jgi:glycerol-1-phosphate dehydrogenase [NAD(P)+]
VRQAPEDNQVIRSALQSVAQTRFLLVEHGARHQAAAAFEHLFGSAAAMMIADSNTLSAAGYDVLHSFSSCGHACTEPFVFEEPHLRAESRHVQAIESAIRRQNAVAVAVGSGTINDLTKLASHAADRSYMVVATAASMDGYAAFGASITHMGSKQTFSCPAPMGILADLEVMEAAPPDMSAAGYADLLAKTVAGADWIIADTLGVEPINVTSWQMIHNRLHAWLDDPGGVRAAQSEAIRSLTTGLLMSGFAMQHANTSRPASGAEHQFSHLWDMQRPANHTNLPLHGFQVGIGTLASSALYEHLLLQDEATLDIDRLVSNWPERSTVEDEIRRRFEHTALRDKALEETRAKYVSAEQIRDQLARLRVAWRPLRRRLHSHLLPRSEIRDRLIAAGCPSEPQQIGVSPEQLRESYLLAYFIRRRFTVLDLAARIGLLETIQ